jgi:hypothetical protein
VGEGTVFVTETVSVLLALRVDSEVTFGHRT